MASTLHTSFMTVTIHTAKCDLCNARNKSTLQRCTLCGWSICEKCWIERRERYVGNEDGSVSPTEALAPAGPTGTKNSAASAKAPTAGWRFEGGHIVNEGDSGWCAKNMTAGNGDAEKDHAVTDKKQSRGRQAGTKRKTTVTAAPTRQSPRLLKISISNKAGSGDTTGSTGSTPVTTSREFPPTKDEDAYLSPPEDEPPFKKPSRPPKSPPPNPEPDNPPPVPPLPRPRPSATTLPRSKDKPRPPGPPPPMPPYPPPPPPTSRRETRPLEDGPDSPGPPPPMPPYPPPPIPNARQEVHSLDDGPNSPRPPPPMPPYPPPPPPTAQREAVMTPAEANPPLQTLLEQSQFPLGPPPGPPPPYPPPPPPPRPQQATTHLHVELQLQLEGFSHKLGYGREEQGMTATGRLNQGDAKKVSRSMGLDGKIGSGHGFYGKGDGEGVEKGFAGEYAAMGSDGEMGDGGKEVITLLLDAAASLA